MNNKNYPEPLCTLESPKRQKHEIHLLQPLHTTAHIPLHTMNMPTAASTLARRSLGKTRSKLRIQFGIDRHHGSLAAISLRSFATSSKDVTPFLGKWMLQPDRSDYALGEPPTAGTYEIVQTDMIENGNPFLKFIMNWTDPGTGESQNMDFSEVLDGEWHTFDAHGAEGVESVSLSLEEDGTCLTSSARKGNSVMQATRELLDGGSEMRVTQSFILSDGNQLDNVSYYVKEG
ncbi:MAG: hypothetical protein SGARI_006240 [Bacillariaceae sp.]